MIYRGVKLTPEKRKRKQRKTLVTFGFILLVVIAVALLGEYLLSAELRL